MIDEIRPPFEAHDAPNLSRPVPASLAFDARRGILALLLLCALLALVFSIVVRVDRVVKGRGALVAADERTDVQVSVGGAAVNSCRMGWPGSKRSMVGSPEDERPFSA